VSAAVSTPVASREVKGRKQETQRHRAGRKKIHHGDTEKTGERIKVLRRKGGAKER
jgi:hypothetical protein